MWCNAGLPFAVCGLDAPVAPAGDEDADESDGVRIDACETGDIELGELARRAWKSATLLALGDRKFPPNNCSKASWLCSGGVQCSEKESNDPGVN